MRFCANCGAYGQHMGEPRNVGTVTVPAKTLVAHLTARVVVTGMQRARLRMRLGIAILHLAFAVIGCNVEVKVQGE